MSNITLFTGPAGSYYYFKNHILKHVRNGENDSYIYILPVNRAVRYLKKDLVRQSDQKALIDPPVFTFPALMRKIYAHLPRKKKIIPSALRIIHLQRILDKYGDQLEYLKFNQNSTPGFISRIDRMLSELSHFGYRPGNFGPPPDTAEVRYRDLEKLVHWLYEAYDNEFIDETMLPGEIAAGLDNNIIKSIFPDLQSVYINGYGIYTPPMLRILNKLGQEYKVFIQLEYDTENTVLFTHTRSAYDALVKMGAKNDLITKGVSSLNLHLFNNEISSAREGSDGDRYILKAAKNREEEVRYIAAQIRKLHFLNKIPLSKFGITFPDIEKYAPKLRKVFEEYEIPYNLSTGYALAQSPLIQAYLQVLQVLNSRFEAGDLIKLLNSPFLSEEMRIDINLMQKIIRQYNLHYFTSGWQEKVVAQTGEEKDLIAGIQHIINIISGLDRSFPESEFPLCYMTILNQLGMLKWDSAELTRTEKEREYRAYNQFYKLLNMIGMEGNNRSMSLRKFTELLYLIIRDASYNLREWSNYGIQCMPRLEIQSLECEVLFIGGLVEGEFPRAFSRDIFFNDQERQQLGLYAVEDLLSQDRFLFYQLLSSSARQIHLVYPSYEEESNLLPSSFIRNLTEVADTIQSDPDSDELLFLNRKNTGEHIFKYIHPGIDPDAESLIRQWGRLCDQKDKDFLFDTVKNELQINKRDRFTKFEGNLSENSFILERLIREAENKKFSITALEMYAFCPMRYFLERIIGLEGDEEEEIQFTALERGALLHNIFFRFFTTLKEKNQHNQPWKYPDLLKEITRNSMAQLNFHSLFWTLEQEIIMGTADKKGLLDTFLEVEQNEFLAHDFKPLFFEYGFGLGGNHEDSDTRSVQDAFAIRGQNRTVYLSGKIDRIDTDSSGDILIIDYKTGKGDNPAVKDMTAGISLQLPVYMAAARYFLDARRPVAGIYYRVHDADNCARVVAIVDAERNSDLLKRGHGRLPNKLYPLTLEELIDQSLLHVIKHVGEMVKGDFSHSKYSERENCRTYCPFKRICRKDVAKLQSMER